MILALCSGVQSVAVSEVVVLSNRTRQVVSCELADAAGNARTHTIEPDDLVCEWVQGTVAIRFSTGLEPREYDLPPNAAYCFRGTKVAGEIDLEEIGVDHANEDKPQGAPRPIHGDPSNVDRPGVLLPEPELLEIPVKLLVDDEERATRDRWERRLRQRVRTASAAFERYWRVRFHIVAVDTWKSNDSLRAFDELRNEFEWHVEVRPATLAIGFTGRRFVPPPEARSVCGEGALRSHILVPEGLPNMSEAERTEMLVHLLGHYLGAAHCPWPDSVMRPTLADRQVNGRRFVIRPDALNTLALGLVVENLRAKGVVNQLSQLDKDKRRCLAAIYATLAEAMPDDSDGMDLAGSLGGDFSFDDSPPAPQATPDDPLPLEPGPPQRVTTPLRRPPQREPGDLTGGASAVVRAVVAAAERNQRLPARSGGKNRGRLKDDELTTYYVTAAAAAAELLPEKARPQAFFLGLAVALDTSETLRNVPLMGELIREVEPDDQRARRLKVLGSPTMRRRYDLTQHFFVSAAIATCAGRAAAESTGLGKELRDADGGSGFSFSDWCADLAGIELAERVKAGKHPLNRLIVAFPIDDYLPPVADLKDGMTRDEFARQFGSVSDRRYLQVRDVILKRIAKLPPYR